MSCRKKAPRQQGIKATRGNTAISFELLADSKNAIVFKLIVFSPLTIDDIGEAKD
jgi:hypothetical protein